jgi:prepilin-type processing-associated H-X9-DG protein
MRDREIAFLKCPTQERLEPTQIYDEGLTDTYQILDTPLRTHYYAVNGAKLDGACPGLTPYETTACGPQGVSRGSHAINGIMYPFSKVRHSQITDGTSHTFLVAECSWDFSGEVAPWYAGSLFWGGEFDSPEATAWKMSQFGDGFWGENQAHVRYSLLERSYSNTITTDVARRNELSFGSKHPGGCHFSMADGSTQFVRNETDIIVLRNLACRHDGVPVTLE